MEPSTSPTTPPPTERRCSPNAKRQRSAAAAQPLGDVTNLLLIPSTPTNPTTSRPRPLPSDASAAAFTCSAFSSLTPVSKPSSSAAASEERSVVESAAISTVIARRNTTQKRKMNDRTPFPAGTASCPPPTGIATAKRKTSVAQGTRPISSSAPCHLSKKKKSTMMENTSSVKLVLPEDFIKKQRAYFEEIDAFELPEEEASETDLE